MTTIIIEMREGVLEGVYSNTDISIFIIERHDNEEDENDDEDENENGPRIAGPYLPTLVKPNVSEAVPDAPNITEELLRQQPAEPFFALPDMT